MAGIRWLPEDAEPVPARPQLPADFFSDDDRSVAADSWSIKSDYGSTLDDEQRHVDASDALSTGTFRAPSDYNSDKEDEQDAEVENSMLGLHSYWDSSYAEDLLNFQEHGHAGEVWFGADVMEVVAVWTRNHCISLSYSKSGNDVASSNVNSTEEASDVLAGWSVLDVGTGNGLFLQELAKQGFCDLTGTDYVEGAIDLARSIANRNRLTNLNLLVDDVLDTKLERQFQLITDKGTLDAIRLHPEGPVRRMLYWESISKLLAPDGILVITSCNSTKDELVQEAESFIQRSITLPSSVEERSTGPLIPTFRYLDHVRTYPTFTFGGLEGSRVASVAFIRRSETS